MKNKIIFWIDGNPFTFLLANFFQKHEHFIKFVIYDLPQKPTNFFKEQNIISFQNSWYFHEEVLKERGNFDPEYLLKFEKKYKINLWQLAINERLFYKYNEFYKFRSDEILEIICAECKLFEKIIQDVKPDIFVTMPTALHHQELFYKMCKFHNIKILMLNQINLGYKCVISEEFNKLDDLNTLESDNNSRNFEDLQNYLENHSSSKQLIEHKNKIRESYTIKFKAALGYLFSKNKSADNNYFYRGHSKYKTFLITAKNFLKTKYRMHFINKIFKKSITDEDSNFIYFPLHQEPERILLIGSPYYTNQLETVRNIAKSIPINYKLYVKEHPTQSMRDWRSLSFYKQILALPNVTLLHPSISSKEIIKKCDLVISVNGSTGFEATFYEKPSIVFTDIGYSILPSVQKIDSIQELPNKIIDSLNYKVSPNELDQYLLFIENNSFDFDYYNFILDYSNLFYKNGNILDSDISTKNMISFMKKYNEIFLNIGNEYLKKIN